MEIGREIVWLQCFGERFVDASAGRAKGPSRLPKGERPIIPKDGTISGKSEPLVSLFCGTWLLQQWADYVVAGS